MKILETLQDETGQLSSKRVAAFIALIFALIAVTWMNWPIEAFTTTLMFAGAALGISEIGKFKSKT